MVTATATAKAGYEFIGWYQQVDGKYDLVSSKPTHSYTVISEGVQTIYARFAPTHTVTYQWASVAAGKCPQNTPDPPRPGTVIDGGTYYISKDFIKDKTTLDGTVKKDGRTVPGKWVFTGWHDGEEDGSSGNDVDIVIRVTELINVTGDRTLTGFWTFIPEKEHTLTYQFAEDDIWTPSILSALAAKKQYFRTEPVTAAGEPSYKQGGLYVSPDLMLKGAWTFGGWKRSDTKTTVKANDKFEMPGNDVTLTGQWSFTPDTYTVSYNIGNGTGTLPGSHNRYDYSAIPDKAGCVEASGIPFGASITLRKFTGTAPQTADGKDTYFAGWSIVNPATEYDVNAIQTYGPGAVVDDETLRASEATNHHVTLYAVYKPVGTATVEFDATPAEGGTVSLFSASQ